MLFYDVFRAPVAPADGLAVQGLDIVRVEQRTVVFLLVIL